MYHSTKYFISNDSKNSLFPLTSTGRFVLSGWKEMGEFIEQQILTASSVTRFDKANYYYALKTAKTSRAVQVLDPFAAYFFYDFMQRNWAFFQLTKCNGRESYGYAYADGRPVTSFNGYHDFRKRKYALKTRFKHYAKIDVADCFNCFSHPDIMNFITSNIRNVDGHKFQLFLNDINTDIDKNVFPQGIYPAKALGNKYLSFIEDSPELKSSSVIRFLDDVFLFSNTVSNLEHDIALIKDMLSARGMSLNEDKTKLGSKLSDFEERNLDKIKKILLEKREKKVGYEDDDEDNEDEEYERDDEPTGLSQEEIEYLNDLIKGENVAEEDVELAVSLLKYNNEEAAELISKVIESYPNLLKNVHSYFGEVNNLWIFRSAIRTRIQSNATEHELFWLAKILLDFGYSNPENYDLLSEIYQHLSATDIVRAVIVEANDFQNKLTDIKLSQLDSLSPSILSSSLIKGFGHESKGLMASAFRRISEVGPGYKVLCDIAATDSVDSLEF